MRYGPLPHRPISVPPGKVPDTDDYHYYSAESIITEDGVDEAHTTSPPLTNLDYGYMEFHEDHCSHEKVNKNPHSSVQEDVTDEEKELPSRKDTQRLEVEHQQQEGSEKVEET